MQDLKVYIDEGYRLIIWTYLNTWTYILEIIKFSMNENRSLSYDYSDHKFVITADSMIASSQIRKWSGNTYNSCVSLMRLNKIQCEMRSSNIEIYLM